MTKNSATEKVAEIQYTYEDAVAFGEPDRFAQPSSYYSSYFEATVPNYLTSFVQDPHDMESFVGYEHVAVQQIGLDQTTNGKVRTSFTVENGSSIPFMEPQYDLRTSGYYTGVSHTYVPEEYNAGNPGYWIENEFNMWTQNELIIRYVDHFSGRIGAPKTEETYDAFGNIISRSTYTYDTIDLGVLPEVFYVDQRRVIYDGSSPTQSYLAYTYDKICQLNISKNVVKKTTIAGKGVSSIQERITFNELTGAVTSGQTSGGLHGDDRTETLLVVDPAGAAAYPDMGFKSLNAANTNDVTATLEEVSYTHENLTGNNGDFASRTANVYSQEIKKLAYNTIDGKFVKTTNYLPYWFLYKTYTWRGPIGEYGLYDNAQYVAFDHTNLSANSDHWKCESEVTLYDEDHNPVEVRFNLSNRFTSIRYAHDFDYTYFEASNSNYASSTYCSFESYYDYGSSNLIFDGDLENAQTQFEADGSVQAHTGNYMAKINSSTANPIYKVKTDNETLPGGEVIEWGLQTGRKYWVSVWVHSNSPANAKLSVHLNGTDDLGAPINTLKEATKADAVMTNGDWLKLVIEIDVPKGYRSSGGANNDLRVYLSNTSGTWAYFDDLMFHSFNTTVSGKVYDQKQKRVIAVIDNENNAGKMEYDAAGRLLREYAEYPDEGFKLVKENRYHTAKPITN